MAVVKLSELMGTRYIINTLRLQFSNAIETAIANGSTVDLSGCRFGPDCASDLRKYYDKVDFINTEDSMLNAMLQNNCSASRQVLPDYTELDLTKVDGLNTYLTLVNTIPENAQIVPKLALSDIKARATLILLIMSRPDVDFDINHCATDIFDFVRDMWIIKAQHHESYYELVAPNICVRNQNAEGLYGHDSYGFMPERSFVTMKQVLPTEFGNAQIIKLDASQKVSDEWYGVVDKAISCLEKEKEKVRMHGKTVKDFLTFKED